MVIDYQNKKNKNFKETFNMKKTKETNKFSNPINSAGEFLYYEKENIKDTATEGTVLESGFNNGLIGGTLLNE